MLQTIPSRELQKNFGKFVDIVKAGECISITQYNRPAFYIVPQNADTEELVRRIAGRRLIRMLSESPVSKAATALSQDDVNALVADCFA
jgi:prevent-host-death family protein